MKPSGFFNHAFLLTLLIVCAFAIAYYFYRGYKVFEAELGDFVPTPDQSFESTSARFAPDAAVHWLLQDSTEQRGFYVPAKNGCVIVYAHGAPGHANGFEPMVRALAERGYGALSIDLPGYGESEGKRNWDAKFAASISAGIDKVVAIDPNVTCFGGFGYSMGTHTIAAAALLDERISALVLLAGYTNLAEQLHHQYRSRIPGMGYFAVLAAYWRNVDVGKMDTVDILQSLRDVPVLVVQGSQDYVIATPMAGALAASVGDGELWMIEGATHVDHAQIAGASYYDRLSNFWKKSLLTGH